MKKVVPENQDNEKFLQMMLMMLQMKMTVWMRKLMGLEKLLIIQRSKLSLLKQTTHHN